MEKHCCRLCGRSFPSGRSLGGHMRSHGVLSSSMEDEEKSVSRYGLRENPKKSRRFDDACPPEKDKLCAKSAKILSTLNSPFEISRNELNNEEDDDLRSRESYEEETEEMQSQSYSEVTVISTPVRKQRRRRRSRNVGTIPAYSSPPASWPEYEKEEENGALCLLMLSRDTYSAIDSSDKTSPIIGFGHKVHSFRSEDDDQQFKKPKVSSFSSDGDHCGKRSLSKECDSESVKRNSCKRTRFVCTICNKSFHSYQALGGHRTSHKKMKGDYQELTNQNCESQIVARSPKNFRSHECLICGKKFPSGQALGGHKRSHLVAANNSASAVVVSAGGGNGVHPYPLLIEIEQKASKRNSIDLNLPASDNDC